MLHNVNNGELEIMIETDRLILREYTMDDFDSLYEIVSDPETMQHYPASFDEERTRDWLSYAYAITGEEWEKLK